MVQAIIVANNSLVFCFINALLCFPFFIDIFIPALKHQRAFIAFFWILYPTFDIFGG